MSPSRGSTAGRPDARAERDSSGSNERIRRLESALEELRISREELTAQNEQLRSMRDLIEEEQQRYADLFDLAPVGYLVTNPEGIVQDANRRAAELLNRELRFLVGKPLAALVGPERRQAFRALIREAASGSRWHDEVPFLQIDGGRVRLLVTALGAGVGSDASIRWSLNDMPPMATGPQLDRLAAAQVVQRRELSALLDRLQRAVLAVGSTLRVTYANAAAVDLLGLGRGTIVGKTLFDPWPEPAPSLCDLAARMFERHAEPAEAKVSLDEGQTFEVLALPPDVSGDALLVIADVTAEERQHRAEREFVSNAAHQLRTPVSAIASAVEVLQGGAKEDPETRDRFLAHLDRQCTRLVRLTRALLLLARAQALSEPPAVEIVPLRPLLASIADGLRPGEDVEVGVDCPFDLAALSNRDLLEQAIGNLAENAAKFTHAGQITLRAERAPGSKVRLVISDTGPGGRFGDRGFHRFNRGAVAQGEGFGLGLAIADETVRALGGELQIESDQNGTRAEVSLPAATVRRR